MIWICERCGVEAEEVEKPDHCPKVIITGGEVLGFVSRDMATDAGEPDMEGMPITDKEEYDICGGQFYMLGDV